MRNRRRNFVASLALVLATAAVAGCPAAPAPAPAPTPPPASAPALPKLSYEYETHEWKEHDPPLKLIKKDEGFCTISGIGGAFNGGGEAAVLYIGDDGYWYLRGQTGAGFLRITATCVKVKLQ
jgi:hypothetical protein